MTWSRAIPLTLLLLLVPCATTRADWFHQFWLDAERMNAWPAPFDCADRQATVAPFELMKNAGWRLEHTLSDPLFTADHQLTFAGKLKVKNILTLSPVHRRSVFVLRGPTPEDTEKRVEAVESWAAQVVTDGSLPPVFVTDVAPRGGTGDYFNQISRKYREMIPPPVLPAQTQTNGGTGSNN